MSRLLAFQPRVYTAPPPGGTPTRIAVTSNAGSSGTVNVPYPSGILSGDKLLLVTTSRTDTRPGAPTGFTKMASHDGQPPGWSACDVFEHSCDGTESGNIAISTAYKPVSATCILVRNTTGFRTDAAYMAPYVSTAECPSITAVANDLIYRVFTYVSGTITLPAGTQVANPMTAGAQMLVMEEGPVSAGATGILQATISQNGYWVSVTIAMGA